MPDSIFRVYRIIIRTLIKYSWNPRPSSHPFITGDGFRNFADHIYDNTYIHFSSEKVKEKDVVFVGDSKMKKFLTEIHPTIKHPYILITHNGDAAIDKETVDFIDEKILKWFGINVLVNHPKVVTIPLGIESKYLYVLGIPWIFKLVMKKKLPKKNLIFYAFTVTTNKEERQPALDVLKQHPLTETIKKWLNFYDYLHLLSTYKFVASPPGSCVEGIRTWDAMYLGVVPIVKSSITIDAFAKLGLPLLSVKEWNEINALDEAQLEKKYDEIIRNGNREPLEMDYWINLINKER